VAHLGRHHAPAAPGGSARRDLFKQTRPQHLWLGVGTTLLDHSFTTSQDTDTQVQTDAAMASRLALAGLAALLVGLVSAQKPGTSAEVHPKLITQRCTKAGGCKDQTNYLVLDALSHPVHQATNAFNCGDWGSKPNATACPTVEACAENCIMDGIPDYSQYGVTTNGNSLRMQQVRNGRVVTPRVYLLDSTEQKYEMPDLTGNEFTFDVDATKLPCGMNSALYLSEMAPDGAKSKLNPGGAFYGTGYCDAQCFVTPFIDGVVSIPTSHPSYSGRFRTLSLTWCYDRAMSAVRALAATRWTSGRPTGAPPTLRRTPAT